MKSSRPVTPRRARPVFGDPPYVAPRYHSRLWGPVIFAILLIILIVGFGVFGGVYWSLHRPQAASAAVIHVHVNSGDDVTTLADRLQREGVINNTLLFRLDAKLQNLGAKLKVGDYTLRRNMSIDQMVSTLTIYTSRTIRITIPEGQRLEQVATIAARTGINRRQFLQAARHPALHLSILRSLPRGATLEGYLFPNTYYIPPHYSARQLVAFMVRTLGQNFTPSMRAAAAREGLTVHDALTLGSIVEREARVASERPLIASVYLNRFHAKQGLFADPTVQYAIGHPGDWWPVLTASPRSIAPGSPYNTYTHGGLPPGPIANPGMASIRAVVYPAHTTYFYFVAKGGGRHAFESTLAQHNQDVCTYEHQCQ